MSYKEEQSAYWRTIIDKHTESGMSAAAFCKQHEINPQRFYFWRRRFHRDPTSAGFIRLVPTSNTAFSGVRVALSDHGITLEVDRGFDSLTLRETIDALRTLGG
jgi:transposase-like protein